MSSALSASRSRARRLRDAATKRRLYEAGQTSTRGDEVKSNEFSKLDVLIEQVHQLTIFVQSFCAYGPQYYDPCFYVGQNGDAVLEELSRRASDNGATGCYGRESLMMYRLSAYSATAPPELQTMRVIDAAMTQKSCSKCTQPLTDCMCEDILCQHCFRAADTCQCEEPWLKRLCCDCCGEHVASESLHKDTFLMPAWPQVCFHCGGVGFVPDEWLFLTPSEHMCQECNRRDCQQTIQQCAGHGCSKLVHQQCMTKVAPPGHWNTGWGDVLLCNHCLLSENVPSMHSDCTSNESEEHIADASGDELPELSNDQQNAFKEWFLERLRRKQQVLHKSIEHELALAEGLQGSDNVSEAKVHLERAKALKTQLQNLDSNTDLREELRNFLKLK